MNNSVPSVLRRTYRLHSYEVDAKGRGRPDILLSFMLDAAWAHANNSEYSYDALREEGQLWVLSRFLALFYKFPDWDNEITIETWGKAGDRIFGLRDFAVYDVDGTKLISATSAWLVIDRKTSRIQKIDLRHSNFPLQQDRHEIETRLEKIEPVDTIRTEFEHVVRYSDLDVNKHVNSSQYVKWIIDSFPGSTLNERELKSLEINFLSEAQVGDRVIAGSATDGDFVYCEIDRQKDDVELCRAKVVWG